MTLSALVPTRERAGPRRWPPGTATACGSHPRPAAGRGPRRRWARPDGPRRQVAGQQPPRAAGAGLVEDRVDDLAARAADAAAAALGQQQRLDQPPPRCPRWCASSTTAATPGGWWPGPARSRRGQKQLARLVLLGPWRPEPAPATLRARGRRQPLHGPPQPLAHRRVELHGPGGDLAYVGVAHRRDHL